MDGLDAASEVTDRRRLVRCLLVLTAVIAGFALHSTLQVEPSLVALLGAAAMVLVSSATTEQFLADVEWETFVFFMALFILVGGLSGAGTINQIGSAAVQATDQRWFLAATVPLFGSPVLGAFVDNIPFTAAMLPVVEDLVASDPAAAAPLWWAFALGADLGGKHHRHCRGRQRRRHHHRSTVRRANSFWQFTRQGLLATAPTLVIAWSYGSALLR